MTIRSTCANDPLRLLTDSIQVAVALPYRIYTYYAKAYHCALFIFRELITTHPCAADFLFDLCYAVNGIVLIYLWILPSSPTLFTACYGLSLGSLGTAIALWRNSLVFHSLGQSIVPSSGREMS